MTRLLFAAVLLGMLTAVAGCGRGGSVTPEKATPDMIEAQKKMQDEADDGERKMQTPAKKKR